MTTLSQLITRVQRRLGQAPGTAVQLYSEDVIAEQIQTAFNQLFDSFYWAQFQFTQQVTLDGSTGNHTGNLSTVLKAFQHIDAIQIEDTPVELYALPLTVNPYSLVGTSPLYYGPITTAGKIFRVYPDAATGVLTIRGRTKPDDFAAADTVDFDSDLLIYKACWEYMIDDGSNGPAIQKYEKLYIDRLTAIRAQLATPQSLSGMRSIPTVWS